MKKIITDNFNPPEEQKIGKYCIRRILPSDNEKDYEAVMSSENVIKRVKGGRMCHPDWPASDFTLEENLEDLKRKKREFDSRQSFNYIVWNKDCTKYIACIYIYPIDKMYPEMIDKFDVDFSMWLTKEAYEKGLYKELYELAYKWILDHWPFEKDMIFHRNAEIPIKLSN